MEGAHSVYRATGEYPVYPGHPLVIAWEIMSVFGTPGEALSIYRDHGLNCPTAVTDHRITGGGGEVHVACFLLRRAVDGESPENLIHWADERWIDGQAGGHQKAVQPGLAQAEKIKPLFSAKLSTWLASERSVQ